MNAAVIRNPKVSSIIPFETREKVESKKEMKNAEYLAMLDRGIKQIKEGKGILLTDAEMERMLNE